MLGIAGQGPPGRGGEGLEMLQLLQRETLIQGAEERLDRR